MYSSVGIEDSLTDDNELELLTITSNVKAEDKDNLQLHNTTSSNCNIRDSHNSYHYQCHLIIIWLCIFVVGFQISFAFCVASYYTFIQGLQKHKNKQAMYGDMLCAQGVFLGLAAMIIFASISVWICTYLKYKTNLKCITDFGANRRASRHSYMRHQTYFYYIVSKMLSYLLATFIVLLICINGYVTCLIWSYYRLGVWFTIGWASYCCGSSTYSFIMCWAVTVEKLHLFCGIDYDYMNKDVFYRHQWRDVMTSEDRFDYILSNWINKYCRNGYENINGVGIGIDIETEIYKYCGKIYKQI